MAYQNISAQITAANMQAVKAALAAVEAELPFLVTLTPAERKSLFKTGNSLTFVQNSLLAAKNNPTVVPGSFNVAEFESDVTLFGALTELGTLVTQLATKLDDTRIAVGSEAMNEASQVYNYVKAAAKTTPGLKPVAEQLAERFKKASPAKAAPSTTAAK